MGVPSSRSLDQVAVSAISLPRPSSLLHLGWPHTAWVAHPPAGPAVRPRPTAPPSPTRALRPGRLAGATPLILGSISLRAVAAPAATTRRGEPTSDSFCLRTWRPAPA